MSATRKAPGPALRLERAKGAELLIHASPTASRACS
jgi:hypothetical protein